MKRQAQFSPALFSLAGEGVRALLHEAHMITVILVIHLIVTIALVGVILLQRSEGGALGIGSSSSGSLFTARGAGNALTRATAILATVFFITSITLTILSVRAEKPGSVFDAANGTGGAAQTQQAPAPAAPAAPKGPQVPVKP